MSDYKMKTTARIPFETVCRWSSDIYQKAGLSKEDADITAHVQAMADLRGVYSHGIQRCQSYINRINAGYIKADAKPFIASEKGSFAIMDGDNAMGQIAGVQGMKKAIELAKQYGSSTVVVRGSNHFGASAYFPMMALEENMIGYCVTQGGANTMCPTNGKEKLVGNNPFAWAIPAGRNYPIVLDMALSVVAAGKIDIARIIGNPIPDNWAVDKNGIPTTDPNAFYALQPIAGYKGYGLSVVTTMLTAVLANCPWGREQGDLIVDDGRPLDIAHMMHVIDVGALMDVEDFKARVDDGIEMLRNSERAEGAGEILMPGEPEYRKMDEQLANGIEYPEELLDMLADFSAKMGVEHLR